jgi:hypothetical protein
MFAPDPEPTPEYQTLLGLIPLILTTSLRYEEFGVISRYEKVTPYKDMVTT